MKQRRWKREKPHKITQDRAKTAQHEAKVVNQVALQAEKENNTAQKEVQELQRVMEPTRARTNATTANDHEECDEQSSDDMDITDYRLDTFKNSAPLRSALVKTFQLHRKAWRSHWIILDWVLWDGLRTGVLEIVLLL